MLSRQGPLERAFAHDERYMLHAGVAANGVDRTLEYSRPVRSLKLWLAFRIYGAATLRRWIEVTTVHARTLARTLAADPRFELLDEPHLSVVCFRSLGQGDLDERNLRLARAICADGRVYLAAAVVDRKVCLRVCFMNFRTDAAHIDELFAVVAEIADTL
jgi:aromatic-L-amino-acid decarboxylase